MTTPAERIIRVRLADYLTPRTGQVIVDHWWIVDENDALLYYTANCGASVSPQCNRDRKVCERLMASLGYPFKVRVRLIPLAFDHDHEDSAYWKARYDDEHPRTVSAT